MGSRYSGELWHHGIIGQKWGRRRYQNADGSLTPEGRKHYGVGPPRAKSVGPVSKAAKAKAGTAEVTLPGTKKKLKPQNDIGSVKSTAKKGIRRLGEGISRGIKNKLAEKFPFMLNDEELEIYRDRLNRENEFRKGTASKRQLKDAAKKETFAENLVKNTIARSVNNIVDPVTRKLGDSLAETGREKAMRKIRDEAEVDKLETQNIKNALDRAAARNKKALERSIKETVDNTAEKRDNEREMDKLDSEVRHLYKVKKDYMSKQNDRKEGESVSDYYSRKAKEQAEIDTRIREISNRFGYLADRNEQITRRNEDLKDDMSMRRQYLDDYNQTQKSPINRDQYNKLASKLSDLDIDIDELLRSQN